MGWSIASASKLSEEVDSTQVLYIGLFTYNLTNKINLLKKTTVLLLFRILRLC